MNVVRKLIGMVVLLGFVTASCSPNVEPIEGEPQPEPTVITIHVTSEAPITAETVIGQSTTQNNLSGNHVVEGSIDLQNAFVLDIPLAGSPLWLVSAAWNDEVFFVAVMDDGTTQAFKVSGQTYEVVEISPPQLPTGMPPLLAIVDGNPQLIAVPEDASSVTNPLIVNDEPAYIANNSDLVLGDKQLPINALPDARILIDEQERLLILTQPTTRYDHGVLGDEFEASAITLIETEPELRVLQTITINESDVIEGISPIWADIDNDGRRDILVTVSNAQSGARIVAYRENGTLLAESGPIGSGYRWRHQIAVAQFKANEPPFLVDIRTPHIGGIVEFFQYNNGKLEIVKEINGFSSHSIGSRNLDSALVGDFNNDGVNELLVPDQPHVNLGIVSLEGVIATLPLDGTLTSNLSATTVDGKIFLGAGMAGKLRIWVP